MKKAEIMNKVMTTFNKVSFSAKKHSPEILVVAGVIGTVASAVIACKATTKLDDILEKTKENVDKIHECTNDETLVEEYTESDAKKDLAIVYARTGVDIFKLYAPALSLGALSITCILASNNILRKRNVALTAAYATVDKSFKEYRSRVVERFGEQIDKELRYDIKASKIEKTVVDEETGKKKKVKEEIQLTGIDGYSDYARFFDEASSWWEKNSEYNLLFLRGQQNLANDKLKAQGYLFLNDVYDMLDIPRSKAGQVVGWVYDPDNTEIDNYVDFGIYELHRERNRSFVNGYERCILLDFNVDGNIWDKFKGYEIKFH